MLRNNHLGNIFAEVITIKTLFASAKPSAIADCQGEFRGLRDLKTFKNLTQKTLNSIINYNQTTAHKENLYNTVSLRYN